MCQVSGGGGWGLQALGWHSGTGGVAGILPIKHTAGKKDKQTNG